MGQDEENSELGKELMVAFGSFDRAYHMAFQKRFAPQHKPGHFMILGRLRRCGTADCEGLRVSTLASDLGVTASSVTQIVTELEAKGLVSRSIDPEDRRAVRVVLSPQGEKLMGEILAPYISSLGPLVRRLGPEKAKTLIELLGEVNDFFMGGAGETLIGKQEKADKEYRDQ